MGFKISPWKKIFGSVIFVSVFFLSVLLGATFLKGKYYTLLSVFLALFSCVPFLIRYERGGKSAGEIAIISVMIALSVAGRMIFSPLPAFKPVSAMSVICGIAFGPEAGFICGCMSAIVSNIFFGQGPWTPFQMLIWGLIGFLSGVFFKRGQAPNRIILSLHGIFAGALYSAGMDIWTSISAEGALSLNRYLFYALSSLPQTVIYMVSNVIFLLFLCPPILQKTERVRKKFGIFR